MYHEGKTRGIDIFKAFKEKCIKAKLSFANLVSVCTDGAPAMKGVREGFFGLRRKELPHPELLIAFIALYINKILLLNLLL